MVERTWLHWANEWTCPSFIDRIQVVKALWLTERNCMALRYLAVSLVPRPPPFFVLRFAFSIIHVHGSRRQRKLGKAWSHSSCEWHQVDARWMWGWHKGEGANCKKQHTGPSVQAFYCSSGLKTLVWSKLLVFTGKKLAFGAYLLHIWISAPPPTSMNETRPSPFFAVLCFVYYTERKLNNKKRGRPGNI